MFRITLRELLTLTAAIALAIVSLRSGSEFWQGVIGLFALFAMGAAIIAAVFERGHRRVFAIGAAIVMVGYGVLVALTRDQLYDVDADMPTTVLLQSMHPIFQHGGWVFTSGGDVPPDASVLSNADGSNSVSGRLVYYEERPNPQGYMPIGHYWFLLLFGYIGGRFAQFIYIRRNKETSQQSPPK
jgi:hypothetical protein